MSLVPVFSGLTPAQQAEVARFARPVTVQPGGFAVHAGTRDARMFVLHSGRVKVSRFSADGHETILRVLNPGDVAGEESFLSGEPPEDDLVAVEPSRLCVFAHRDIAELLSRYPDIGVGMLRAMASKLTATKRMVTALTSADVGERLAAYLLACPATWDASGRAVVHLPLARKDVATYLGTTPETLSRRLTEFEHDGLLRRLKGRDIAILDPAGLQVRASA